MVLAQATEYHLLARNKSQKHWTTTTVKWQPPNRGFYKLNIDGSSMGNTGIGGLGGVIRNGSRNWFIGYMRGYPSITNNLAKLLAILEGLKLIKEHNLTPLMINTNSI